MSKRKFQFSLGQVVNFLPLLLLLLLVLIGCQVKSRSGTETQVAAVGLPDGMILSTNKKFVVRAAPPMLKPNEVNDVTYTVVTENLEPLDDSYTFETDYEMPDMAMVIDPATQRRIGPNRVEFSYTIAHGGKWKVTLKIKKGADVLDTAVYTLEVPN